jgi:hypothetical protein
MQQRLKHFGWGREGEGLTPAEEAFVLGRVEQRSVRWPRAKSNRAGGHQARTAPAQSTRIAAILLNRTL